MSSDRLSASKFPVGLQIPRNESDRQEVPPDDTATAISADNIYAMVSAIADAKGYDPQSLSEARTGNIGMTPSRKNLAHWKRLKPGSWWKDLPIATLWRRNGSYT